MVAGFLPGGLGQRPLVIGLGHKRVGLLFGGFGSCQGLLGTRIKTVGFGAGLVSLRPQPGGGLFVELICTRLQRIGQAGPGGGPMGETPGLATCRGRLGEQRLRLIFGLPGGKLMRPGERLQALELGLVVSQFPLGPGSLVIRVRAARQGLAGTLTEGVVGVSEAMGSESSKSFQRL
jgi:hypothetical protein